MHIRVAHPEDAPAIHALKLRAFDRFREQYTLESFDATVLDDDRILGRMTEGPMWIAVAEDGQIVGTISAVKDDLGVYLRGLAVHPDRRRQGIAHRLLVVAEGYAHAVDASFVWLSTTPFLGDSIALYEKTGFKESDGPSDLQGTPLRSFKKNLSESPWK